MGFLAALRFLTIIPLPGLRFSPREVGRSLAYFPAVGAIIGFILIGLNWLLGLVLPQVLVNLLLIVLLAVISGGLHLGGLAKTSDGLVRGKRAARRGQVMKERGAGAFGIIGVSLLLLIKYASLNAVPALWIWPTLLLMPVLSRWAIVWAVFAYPSAKASRLGRVFKQEASLSEFLAATVIALAIAVMPAQLSGLLVMLGLWILVTAIAFYLKGRFGGLTADNYGAINEMAEVFVLLLVLLLVQTNWLA